MRVSYQHLPESSPRFRRDGRRPAVQDCWIAATAAAHAVPIYTQGTDFDDIPGIQVVRI
jgi:predicted nucleic acid-binding protein